MTDDQVQHGADAEGKPHLSDHDSASAQEVVTLAAKPNEYYARVITNLRIRGRENRSHSDELLARISINPGILGGKPIIRGMRIAVEHVLGWLAAGSSVDYILEQYDALESDDIRACQIFAYRMVAGEEMYIRVADQADS